MITRLIGVRIKELRGDLGESQEAFANRIGMARSYFAEVETGKRNVSARNLLAIVRGLGVTLAEFFNSELFDPLYRKDEPRVGAGGLGGFGSAGLASPRVTYAIIPFPPLDD